MLKHCIFLVFLFICLVVSQNDDAEFIDGEKCNDQDLYDLMIKATTRASNRIEIRQLTMGYMQELYPMARSMGSICTSRGFQFPKGTNHRYCTVRHDGFKCHSIVF